MSVFGHIKAILRRDYGLSADDARAVIATHKAVHPGSYKQISREYNGGEADQTTIGVARGVAVKWRQAFKA